MKRLLLVLLCACLCSSCAMLPQEDAFRTAPVVKPYVAEAFPTMEVLQGNLFQTAKITCRFVPVKTASLAFALSDEAIDKVLVQAGDQVEEGQLLAQLRLGNLEERIDDTMDAMAELELRRTYLAKQHDLALRRHEILSARLSAPEAQDALAVLQQDYALRSQELLDALDLQRLTLETLQQDVARRQICAPFAGSVTKVAHFEEGDLSSLNSSVVTLVDSTMSLFMATTEYWDRFTPGEEYDIVVSNRTYRAAVADCAALGLDVGQRTPGERGDVYFVLTQPDPELKGGNIGTLMLTLAEYIDVLYLPKTALSSSNGQPIVYYQREDGMKAIKPVETGATIGDYTVILSGLTPGEIIIADQERAY